MELRSRGIKGTRQLKAGNRKKKLFDYPVVWPDVLRKQVLLEDESNLKPRQYTISAVMHLKRNLLIRKRDLRNRYLRDAITDKPGEKPEQPAHSLMETLFRIMKPKVIIGTADTLRQTFKTEPFLDNWKTWVRNVVVDESSQIGHHTVTNLAFCFPRGKFLFVGDAMQLPPYAEHSYPQNLYRIHSGPVFANTIHRQLIPNLSLTRCYRCPSQSVELISRLYYNGQWTAAKKPSNENPMLKGLGLPDRTPSVIINTSSEERKEGTSWTNQQEMIYAIRLAERFLTTPECEGKTMAIISFYLAQSQEVAAVAPAGIHVGSVDATQGREYDLVVLLTTRSQEFSEFACSPERFTVAVSRHREALVVLGNTRRMIKPDNWKALLDATAKTSIVNATAVPFLRNSNK
ncbi:hypothetical protein CRE_09888 [Caenorhabditis remanei]|uniref:DNA2/NAM7 helicase-like C-terminal domain-containing protein n=1 Tax=Caenorhabditis remanei TaxID=31234 RepID=E3NMA6_CAERE|nr:hypothetical protein CRE_09888 [Caenorhabditis remanei]